MALPASGYFTNPARTNGEAKQAQNDMLAALLSFGSAATHAATDFATAAQGAKADTAVQASQMTGTVLYSGYQKFPSGLIKQGGLTTLSATTATNPQTIGGITWYTTYYIVTLPTTYPTHHFSVIGSLFGNSAYLSGIGNPATLNFSTSVYVDGENRGAFTVAVISPWTGWTPIIFWESRGN